MRTQIMPPTTCDDAWKCLRKRVPTTLADLGLPLVKEKSVKPSQLYSNLRLVVAEHAGTIPIIRVQSTQFTSAAGVARFLIESVSLMRSLFETRMMSLTFDLSGAAEKFGSRLALRVGTNRELP